MKSMRENACCMVVHVIWITMQNAYHPWSALDHSHMYFIVESGYFITQPFRK